MSTEKDKKKVDQAMDDLRDDPEYQSEVQRIASLMKQKGALERNASEQDQKKFMTIFICICVLVMIVFILRLFRLIPLIIADCVFGGILIVCLIIMEIRKRNKE